MRRSRGLGDVYKRQLQNLAVLMILLMQFIADQITIN
jgi:hypothetical protein